MSRTMRKSQERTKKAPERGTIILTYFSSLVNSFFHIFSINIIYMYFGLICPIFQEFNIDFYLSSWYDNLRKKVKHWRIIMRIVILDRKTIGLDTPLDSLYDIGEVAVYDSTYDAELRERVVDADVLVFNKVRITDEIMSLGKSLKLLCVTATGYDNIDVAAAQKRGIAVCNVPGYSTDSVTLYTIAMVTSLLTHIREHNQYVRSGEYTRSGIANRLTPVYHEIRGLTWGVIGYGAIGKSVARVAEALGARILACKRTPIAGVECVDIDTLCRESDIITIHCPLNSDTINLINKERISIMKPSVIIANLARGAIVNDIDISEALLDGRIGGFGSDVYALEPMSLDNPLQKIMHLDNVLLTPHSAWGAYEARARCIAITSSNIKAFVDGKTLNRVDI